MLLYFLINKLGNFNVKTSFQKILNNDLTFYAISLVLILYIVYTSIEPNPIMVEFMNNDLSRLLYLLLLVGVSTIRFELGFLMTMAFLVTIYNDKSLNAGDNKKHNKE